jgi:RND family efflux transporter MFP subunit
VARANVPQNQAGFVHVGDSATVTALDGGVELPGKVTVVSPATDPASTTVQVWVQAENPGERLKPGASVRVSIVAATIQKATVVPLSAILPGEDGGTAVAVAGSDSLAHLKKVEIGVREPGQVQILSGVAPGEQVIVAGGVGLEDKAKIRIVKPGETDEKDSKEK